ncbi:MAG: NUDIX domain-containing protein [Desulfatitalea sp.]
MTPTHAGTVVFQETATQPLFLVISSSNGLHWVLPNGHIDPGESAESAALRELREEAGIRGESIQALGVQHYRKLQHEAVAQYFLVRALETVAADEQRVLRWEDERAALDLLSFQQTRAALRQGADALRRLGKRS